MLFLDFITEEMDENNFITNTKLLRKRFNDLMIKVNLKPYTDAYLSRCFKAYCDTYIAFKQDKRGLYLISPAFYFNGTEEERRLALIRLLKWKYHQDSNYYSSSSE